MAGLIKIAGETKSKGGSNEEVIFNTFQTLRDEQRQIVNKLVETELEESELKVVINTLEKVDGNRKCYRLIGGVLCEKTVKDVLPVLQEKREELSKIHSKLKEDLIKNGTELNDFKEKHNIKVQRQERNAPPAGDKNTARSSTSGVLSNA